MKLIYSLVIGLLLTCLSINSTAQIVNIEGKRIATDTTGFAGKVGVALNASKYAQSYVAANLHSHLQYKTTKDFYLFIADYEVVNAGGESFNNSAFAHLRYNRKLSKVIRWEIFSQAQYNSVTKIQLRLLNGLGLRFKMSEYERAKFYWGISAMYEHEDVQDISPVDDIRLNSYLTFTLQPEETVKFINTTYAQPLAKTFSDYRISNTSKLIFDITKKLKFITDFSFLYDSKPPIDIPQVNYQIRNGLTYKF